jgi:nucleoside diphosphate kinase
VTRNSNIKINLHYIVNYNNIQKFDHKRQYIDYRSKYITFISIRSKTLHLLKSFLFYKCKLSDQLLSIKDPLLTNLVISAVRNGLLRDVVTVKNNSTAVSNIRNLSGKITNHNAKRSKMRKENSLLKHTKTLKSSNANFAAMSRSNTTAKWRCMY